MSRQWRALLSHRAGWPPCVLSPTAACRATLTAMEATDARRLLESAKLGARVAEDEIDELADYFVETNQWRRVYAGERDVVLGPKGSGKSALYSLVVKRGEDLLAREILVLPAENPAGTPAFEAVAADPPTSEDEFEGLWKLYFLSLIGDLLDDWKIDNGPARDVYAALEEPICSSAKRRWAQGSRRCGSTSPGFSGLSLWRPRSLSTNRERRPP